MWLDLINHFAFPIRWLWITMQIFYKEDQLLDLIAEYEVLRTDVGIHGLHYDTECFEMYQDIHALKDEISRLKIARRKL